MRAGRRDLEAAAQGRVPPEIGEIGELIVIRSRGSAGGTGSIPLCQLAQTGHVVHRHHLQAPDQGGLVRVLRRHRDAAHAPAAGALGHRERLEPGGRPVQGELPGQRVTIEHSHGQLTGRHQQRRGDRQVEARSRLAKCPPGRDWP